MYQGKNFIYESLSSSINEEKEDKKKEAMDALTSLSTILNNLFSIILNSKNEGLKTTRGFSEVKNKMLGISNFGAFRQYVISLVQSLGSLDPAQKSAFDKNVGYLMDLFRSLETVMADERLFNSAKEDTIKKMLNNFEADLAEREKQMKKTKPSLYAEVKKSGDVVEEAKRSGEETDTTEAEFRTKAFNKSKESLDAATAFVGMVDRDKYVPALKDNADVERYKDIASGLYQKAQDLQMVDRKGLQVITPKGAMKRKDYMRDQDNLINEIIRQKKEYNRIKDGILKQGGFTPPPVVPPVCPPGKVYDTGKGICVSIEKEEVETTPVTTKECTFPIKLNTKCNEIGKIQSKLMELIPSIKTYLSKKGGADKVYGKGTSAACNIVWAYLSGETGQELTADLTKEMYDGIMGLTSNDIDVETVGTAFEESKNWEMSFAEKVQEREEVKGTSILTFDDFFSVIEENLDLEKLDEQVFDRLKAKDPEKEDGKEEEKETEGEKKKLKDKCIKDSLAAGKVLPCAGTDKDEDKEDKDKEDKEEEETIEWKGLKPVNDGAYSIYYDESWSEWFSGVGKGALISGLVLGAVALTAGTITPFLAAGSGALAAAGTAVGTGILAAGGAAAGVLGTAGTFATGAIGGAVISKWIGDDRKPVTVIVFNGYIEPDAAYAMARGLYNSLGGTVSSPDLLAIISTLLISRGTYTNDGAGKAIPVWSLIEQRYLSLAGESIQASINGIVGGGVGGFFKDIYTDMDEIPAFPRFKTKNPTSGAPKTFEDALDSIKGGVNALAANESKIRENCKNITEEDLDSLAEGMDEITVGVSDMAEEE